jgi:glycosyltransferase involved in cell wall biosynthesis
MEPPKISIVIPSYNKASFIGKTLESIFVQKYKNPEVIIQDGGSTDGTVEIIKNFAKRYPIIWESKRDKGQLDAINVGLKKATGEILTFINADDCYVLGAFAAISDAYVKNSNALWFAGRGIVINESGHEIAQIVTWYKNLLLSLNSRFHLLVTNYLMQPSVFFTRLAYKKYGPFTGTLDFITEYDFWLKLGKISMPVVLNKNISKFRIEPNTKTKRMSNKLLLQDWEIVNKYTKSPIVLMLHKLNNLGRILVEKFV